jgi:hypothetical protein
MKVPGGNNDNKKKKTAAMRSLPFTGNGVHVRNFIFLNKKIINNTYPYHHNITYPGTYQKGGGTTRIILRIIACQAR